MNKLQPERIAKDMLIPLAEAFEDLCSNRQKLSSFLLLNNRKIPHYFEVARNYLEYHRTPAHAQALADRVTGSINMFRALPFPRLPEAMHKLVEIDLNLEKLLKNDKKLKSKLTNESQQICDKYIREVYELEYRKLRQSDEYQAAVASAAETADYLRQLAYMMTELRQRADQELENGGRKATHPRRPRRKAVGDAVLQVIDECIGERYSPTRCLRSNKLKNVSRDPWLNKLKEDFPDIKTFGDIADRKYECHSQMFSRFKGVYYRRRTELNSRK